MPPIRFREVAAAAGISFVLENHPTDRKHMIETMPGGIAVFDYDGDGRPDIYFTNGADIPSLEKILAQVLEPPVSQRRQLEVPRCHRSRRAWREQAIPWAPPSAISITTATPTSSSPASIATCSIATCGNGTFEDVTAKAGIASGEWAVAAGWFDYDRDGKLDLWVVHYAKWSTADDRYCGDAARGIRIYCHPKYFTGLANSLYRNRGDGTFEDVTAKAGLAKFPGRGMSVAFADYDGDGWPDVFVTNDNMPNFLFHNLGNGKFEEVALVAGAALRDDGKPVASMGTEFKDYDNDGRPDIFFTALAGETYPVFRNAGKGNFVDATLKSRVGPLTVRHSGWGLGLFDFNNDGWKDLFSANSHVNDRVDAFESAVYKEADSVLANAAGVFQDVSTEAGLTLVKAHRGAAFADFDGDGRIDAVVSSLGAPAELWQNVSPEPRHWLILRLRGTKSNRDGIGAKIRIADQYAEMTTAAGYASSSDWGVHFGLNAMAQVPKIEIQWPSGILQTLQDVRADQVLTVTEPN